uniref:Uncharacterized protein n=1 Tax=Pelusios castaneus TaxID=367368 RepID=A0A8C8SKX7_9SAUR
MKITNPSDRSGPRCYVGPALSHFQRGSAGPMRIAARPPTARRAMASPPHPQGGAGRPRAGACGARPLGWPAPHCWLPRAGSLNLPAQGWVCWLPPAGGLPGLDWSWLRLSLLLLRQVASQPGDHLFSASLSSKCTEFLPFSSWMSLIYLPGVMR